MWPTVRPCGRKQDAALPIWFFASDLHGDPNRYRRLFERVADERPAAVLSVAASTAIGRSDHHVPGGSVFRCAAMGGNLVSPIRSMKNS
jgi:hypothetical protein